MLSQHLYQKSLNKHASVLFNPDVAGNPVIINSKMKNLLEKCRKDSSRVHRSSLFPPETPPKDKKVITAFLKNYCFATKKVADNNHKTTIGIWLHITNNCNLRCPYCFVNKSKGSLSKTGADIFIDSLLHEIRCGNYKNVKIKFSGGEPLLRTDLIEYIIRTLNRKNKGEVNISYAVLSNGTLINKKTIRLLKNYNIGIGISLDGHGDVHDKTRKDCRGRGCFKIIERNIHLLKTNTISPFIMATISRETIDFLPQLTRWLLDNKLFARYSFVRYPKLPMRDYNLFCGKIITAIKTSIKEIQEHPFGPAFLLHWKLADLSFAAPITRQPCGIGKTHIVINHRGELALCPMTQDQPIGIVSNDIFGQYDKYKPLYDQKSPCDESCKKCQWHGVCGTGCPVLNEQLFGDPNKKSPFCVAYRKLIPLYVDAYGWALQQLNLQRDRFKHRGNELWSKEI